MNAYQKKFAALTPEGVRAFLEDIEHHALLIADVPVKFTCPRDPNDECYINLAIAAQARYLVSCDKDILELVNDDDFRGRFPELVVIDPGALLQVLAAAPDEADVPAEGPAE